mgnify:CR=1
MGLFFSALHHRGPCIRARNQVYRIARLNRGLLRRLKRKRRRIRLSHTEFRRAAASIRARKLARLNKRVKSVGFDKLSLLKNYSIYFGRRFGPGRLNDQFLKG